MDEYLSLRETAHLVHLSTQAVVRAAEDGQLPGVRRSGKWLFHRRALMDHLASEIPQLSGERLAGVELALAATAEPPSQGQNLAGTPGEQTPPGLADLLCVEGIELDLPARTRVGVLDALIRLADRTELVWDAPALAAAVRRREEQCSTALDGGIAVPHPRRTPENCVAESLIVFGRTGSSGIHFGAADGLPVDLFFLVACTDEADHLRTLARLCRRLRQPHLATALRQAHQAQEILNVLGDADAAS